MLQLLWDSFAQSLSAWNELAKFKLHIAYEILVRIALSSEKAQESLRTSADSPEPA